jgi:3-oxoacyl-[acyl-carrier protein] reductase
MTESRAKNVIVTGANRGTGIAIAAALSKAGWQVWGLNRTPAGVPWMREVPCDLSRPDMVATAVATVFDAADGVDAIVANAVTRSLNGIATLEPRRWREALEINLTSNLLIVQGCLPSLRERRGHIVLMGSHAGSRFFEGGACYCAAKAAFKALTEVLLLEERPHGVRTTLISPGAIANETGDESPYKLSVESVGETVRWVLEAPEDSVIGEIELRPARMPAVPVTGLDRLLVV